MAYILLGSRADQDAACGKREFQDLFNLAQFTGCLKNDLFFLQGNLNFLRFKNQYFYKIPSLLQTGKQDFLIVKVSERINEGRANYWTPSISVSIL